MLIPAMFLLISGLLFAVEAEDRPAPAPLPDRGAFPIPEMTELPEDLEPFEYDEADIAFYPPGARSRGDGSWNQMQRPLSPEESARHIVTPVGFEAVLFASEPDIEGKPIAMNWDDRGRLWLIESIDYPNELQPEGQGRDRIRILEDTNGDGLADKFTVFAENLSIPTSLIFSRGGVIVHQAPQTLFLKDTTGDDVADIREVLFEGWSTADSHAGPSNLRYGLDNWLWSTVGYAGFRGAVGEDRHEFRQGFFRFRPDGSELEFVRSTNNNTWGLGFSEEGIVFGSTANRVPSVYMPIPNRYYEQVRGWSAEQLGGIADTHLFRAITDKVRQVDHHGGYTAAAGHALYTARNYPEEYWNRAAFVAEPTGHLVGVFVIDCVGADFRSTNPFNLMASDDEWTAPTMAEVGPDGNVWVIDWYNYIVQHNPTPAGYETGKGAAYVTPLRDKKHARIYRIVRQDSEPVESLNLADAPPATLVETLAHPNMFWRQHAQRLLVERGEKDVIPALVDLITNQDVDAIGLNVGAIHALWTLQGLGALDGSDSKATAATVEALRHPSPGVRRNAALVQGSRGAEAILRAGLLEDPDAQVRLAALLALADQAEHDEAGKAVARMLRDPSNSEDRWILDAATSAGAAHADSFLKELRGDNGADRSPRSLETVAIVAEHFARGRPDAGTINDLIANLETAEPEALGAILDGLARGWPSDHTVEISPEVDALLAGLFDRLPAASQAQLARLSTTWGSRSAEKHAGEIVAALRLVIDDESLSNRRRAEAARQFIAFRSSDEDAVNQLLDRITPRTDPSLAADWLEAVSQSRAEGVGAAIMERLGAFLPATRQAAFRVLLSRPAATRDLLDAAEAGEVALADLALDQQRALAEHPDRRIAARASRLLARGGGLPNPDREKIVQEYKPLIEITGNADQGFVAFQEHCGKCHVHGVEGQQVGPNLTGMAVHPKEELLIQILDPSRDVEGTYRTYTVATADGRVLNGMLASETNTTIELIDTDAQRQVILREDIEELVASDKSLMPEGFEQQLTREELADLLEFLTRRERFLPIDLRRAATIVTTRGMFNDENSMAERLIFPDWSPKTFEGIPFQLIDPRDGQVPNAVMLRGPRGQFPPKMPRSVSIDCNAPAEVIHLLSGISGWGAQGPREEGTVSMIVRLHYEDGQVEDHELYDGRHFADYIGPFDVPESTLAFRLRGQQVRYLAIHPGREEVIDRIELIKGSDNSAPVVLALTLELPE